MKWCYYGIIGMQIIFVWIVAPLLLVYYESNENDAFIKRVFKALRAQLPMIIILILLVVPTYYSNLDNYNIPAQIAHD